MKCIFHPCFRSPSLFSIISSMSSQTDASSSLDKRCSQIVSQVSQVSHPQSCNLCPRFPFQYGKIAKKKIVFKFNFSSQNLQFYIILPFFFHSDYVISLFSSCQFCFFPLYSLQSSFLPTNPPTYSYLPTYVPAYRPPVSVILTYSKNPQVRTYIFQG